jgi:hypothetical protein
LSSMQKKKRKMGQLKHLGGSHDGAGDANDIPPADAPRLAARRALLLEHADVAPKRPCAAVATRDVDTYARRGLRCDERGGDLGRVGCEAAEGGRGGAEEARGEAAAAEGGEHAEREHVDFEGGRGGARGQV